MTTSGQELPLVYQATNGQSIREAYITASRPRPGIRRKPGPWCRAPPLRTRHTGCWLNLLLCSSRLLPSVGLVDNRSGKCREPINSSSDAELPQTSIGKLNIVCSSGYIKNVSKFLINECILIYQNQQNLCTVSSQVFTVDDCRTKPLFFYSWSEPIH